MVGDKYRAHAASVDMSAETGRTVVWFAGEHDAATASELSGAMAWAIGLGEHDVVVDLSMVEFMDGSTAGVIIRARNLLHLRSRCLTLRSPSYCSRRVLDICGLSSLVEASSVRTLSVQAVVDARSMALARRM